MKNTIEYKNLNEVADIIIGIPEEKTQDEQDYEYYCIQPSHLQGFNQISKAEVIFRSSHISSSALVKVNDILVKRLSPSNINLLTEKYSDTYVSGNIMIIRTKGNIDAKYIAGILETQGLPALQHNTTRGTSIQTISKAEIQNVKIPLLPLEKQKIIGEIWLLSKEKQRLLKMLADEESKYIKALLDTLFR